MRGERASGVPRRLDDDDRGPTGLAIAGAAANARGGASGASGSRRGSAASGWCARREVGGGEGLGVEVLAVFAEAGDRDGVGGDVDEAGVVAAGAVEDAGDGR